jgi:copper chaperone NosL
MIHFIKNGSVKKSEIAQTVFIDYSNDKNFIDVQSGFFVVSPQLKSPMNGNAACFSSKEIAEQKAKESSGILKTRDQVYQSL